MMQYTCPDIIFDTKRVSSHDGIKHLICYPYGLPYCTIIYHAVLDRTNNHDILQEVSPGNFHSKNISNGLVAFSYGGESCSPNDKQTISCVIICIFGVDVIFSSKTQPASADHSKDSEVQTL